MQSDHAEKKPAQGKCPHCSREIELRWRHVETGSPSYDQPEFVIPQVDAPEASLRASIVLCVFAVVFVVLLIWAAAHGYIVMYDPV